MAATREELVVEEQPLQHGHWPSGVQCPQFRGERGLLLDAQSPQGIRGQGDGGHDAQHKRNGQGRYP